DTWFPGKRGFDTSKRTRFAARWQRHDVNRVHEVGYIAAEAEEANVVHHTGPLGDFVQLAPQLALTADPELRSGYFAQHGGARGEEVEVTFLFRETSECTYDGRIRLGAMFGTDDERVARRIEIVGGDRVVQHGKSLSRDALLHEMLLYR